MAVTLAQAKLNTQEALAMGVIDEFQKNSFILRNLTFDNCISPTGGGSTLTYTYTRLKTQPTAEFRDVNTEYTTSEVEKERHSADLKIFGGAFTIDRVISDLGGIVSEVTLQLEQKVKAAVATFNDGAINGDSGVDGKTFDGLDKMLTGSSTEIIPTTAIDLSTSDKIDANYKHFVDQLDEFLLGLDGTPTMIAGNSKLIAKIRAVARRVSMYSVTKDEFGYDVEKYGTIPLIDLGTKAGTNDDVVGTNTSGETSLYAVRFGLDAFHGVSLVGDLVRTWLPDFKTAGAVKKGEVEIVATTVLKKTKAAGVLRKIKVK